MSVGGGVGARKDSARNGGEVNVGVVPRREGWRFREWFVSAAGGGVVYCGA